MTTECVRPFKLNIAPRMALSRTEVVEQLYKQHGLQNRLEFAYIISDFPKQLMFAWKGHGKDILHNTLPMSVSVKTKLG